MRIKTKTSFLTLIFLFLITLTPVNSAKIYVEPSRIEDIPPGSTFDVYIKVEDVENFYAFQFRLTYNQDVLELVSTDVGAWFSSDKKSQCIPDTPATSPYLACSYEGENEGKSGSGEIARLTFKAKTSGESEFMLQDTILVGYDPTHGSSYRIPHIVGSGGTPCSGSVTLNLSPNPVWIGKRVTATISGLSNCTGKIATVSPKKYPSVTSCKCEVFFSGCSCSFSTPIVPGDYVYYAKVDLNQDENLDEWEMDEKTLTVICQGEGDDCDVNRPCCPPYYCINGKCQRGTKGCPVLKAWNGKEFQKIEKLNIHSKEGTDTTYSTSFKMKPYDKDTYRIILEEKWYALWEGSHIDYVKLIDFNGKECNLIKAIHSRLGDVTSLIKENDDERVETKPGEKIELIYTGCSGDNFTLEIEGYNPWGVVRLFFFGPPVFVKESLSYTGITVIVITVITLIVIFIVLKIFMRKHLKGV